MKTTKVKQVSDISSHSSPKHSTFMKTRLQFTKKRISLIKLKMESRVLFYTTPSTKFLVKCFPRRPIKFEYARTWRRKRKRRRTRKGRRKMRRRKRGKSIMIIASCFGIREKLCCVGFSVPRPKKITVTTATVTKTTLMSWWRWRRGGEG